MSKSKGSSDEAIGRPTPWREGRYQEANKPVDQTVDTEAEPDAESTKTKDAPVTRKDYEQQ